MPSRPREELRQPDIYSAEAKHSHGSSKEGKGAVLQKLGKTRKPGVQLSSAILSTCLAWMGLLAAFVPAYGDDQIANSPAEQPSVSTDELFHQIQQLRQELEQLRNNQRPPLWFSPDADLRGFSSPASPPPQNDGSVLSSSGESGSSDGIMREDVADPTKHCVGIAVDVEGGMFYWMQKGEVKAGQGRLFRANIEIPPGQTASTRKDIELLYDALPEPIDLEKEPENLRVSVALEARSCNCKEKETGAFVKLSGVL